MNKFSKVVVSLTLGTTLLLSSVSGASAATYTVKSGDTLSGIAKKYGTTYKDIMNKNGLKSTSLRIGQKLEVGGSTAQTTSNTSASSKTTTSSTTTTYVVKKGDSLSKIAKNHNTTYQELMKLNGLKSTSLKVGQTLKVSGKASTLSTTTVTSESNSNVVSVAKKLIGAPYVFGGASPKGFDCSGFVYYAYKNAGKSISRSSAATYYKNAKKVVTPQVGDLVFFSNTYKSGISHVAIYIGNGQMIGASGKSVNISNINSAYWKKHFTGYGRL